MSLQVVCSCGKQLDVPEVHAGRSVKCPTCGEVTAVPADHSTGSRKPGGLFAGRAGGAASVPRAAPRRRSWLWLAGPLLLLAGAGVAWWLFRPSPNHVDAVAEGDGPEVTDMQLVPPTAQGFGTIRLAELWKMPEVQEAVESARNDEPKQEDLAQRLERVTGLTPGQVERLHAVGADFDKQLGWLVARTIDPIDRERVLARLADRVERRHEERRYYLGKSAQGQEVAIHFGGPKVLVVAGEEGMKRCMEQAAKPVTKGPLKPIVALAEGGKSQIVLGGYPKGGGLKSIKSNTQYKFLADIKLFQATVNVGKEADLKARVTMETEDEAKGLRVTLNFVMFFIRLGHIAPMNAKGGEQAKLAKLLTKALDAVKFKVEGKDLVIRAKTDTPSVITALLLAAKQASKP
jgi:hypothetical protein